MHAGLTTALVKMMCMLEAEDKDDRQSERNGNGKKKLHLSILKIFCMSYPHMEKFY